jgi:hypothetical protein
MWFRRTFGSGPEVWQDGPDPARIRDLTGEPKAEAEWMLRRGLASCSTFAVTAIEGAGWRDMVPDLVPAVAFNDADFRARVILALNALGNRDDFTEDLITVLSLGPIEARMTAAIGARRFSLERFRRPLLERVREDRSGLVRVHAAESLIALADIYPRPLAEHPAIFAAVAGDPKAPDITFTRPLTADQKSRLNAAADQLDAEISKRLAAGLCPEPTRRDRIGLHIIPIRGRQTAALTVEDSIGPCARTLGFVVFLESSGGFPNSIETSYGRDPLKVEIQARPTPVTVTYSRATGVLTVGALTFDTAKANVAVVFSGPGGIVARYQGKVPLTFERNLSPAAETEMDEILDSRGELKMAVRSILDRTPELRRLVEAP